MKKERLKKVFTDAASDVADQFYPKGKTERRGEFIRDCGALYIRLEKNLDEYVKSKHRRPTAIHATMIAEDIMDYFTEELEGISSDIAWYELVGCAEDLVTGDMEVKEFVKYIEITFGVKDHKHYTQLRQKSDERFKQIKKLMYGEKDA